MLQAYCSGTRQQQISLLDTRLKLFNLAIQRLGIRGAQRLVQRVDLLLEMVVLFLQVICGGIHPGQRPPGVSQQHEQQDSNCAHNL